MFRMNYVDPKEFFDSTTKNLSTGKASFTVKKVKTQNEKGEPLLNRKGHEMIQLVLDVRDSSGKSGTLIDYLHGNFPSKIYEFLVGVGKSNFYCENGFHAETLVGSKGEVSITMRPTDKNPEGVPSADYYYEPTVKKQQSNEEFDDDIPF